MRNKYTSQNMSLVGMVKSVHNMTNDVELTADRGSVSDSVRFVSNLISYPIRMGIMLVWVSIVALVQILAFGYDVTFNVFVQIGMTLDIIKHDDASRTFIDHDSITANVDRRFDAWVKREIIDGVKKAPVNDSQFTDVI